MVDKYESYNNPEKNFRKELSDRLKLFVIQAVREQSIRDDAYHEKGIYSEAGSLYKIDQGRVKILLQAPAGDRSLYDDPIETHDSGRGLPDIWIAVSLANFNEDSSLEDAISESSSLSMYAIDTGGESVEMWIADDYIGVINWGDMDDGSSLVFEAVRQRDSNDTQERIAENWLTALEGYDIRTIAKSSKKFGEGLDQDE